MVPSGPDFLRAWAGVGRLGAVAVVLNCELKGTFLAHPLVDSGARFFVVDPTFVGRLEGLSVALTILTTGVDGEFSRWRNAQHYEGPLPDRPEEHTSELQSLMRISYAVFCLKKKTK